MYLCSFDILKYGRGLFAARSIPNVSIDLGDSACSRMQSRQSCFHWLDLTFSEYVLHLLIACALQPANLANRTPPPPVPPPPALTPLVI